ncbi:hypothetical protein BDZ91DRAFT_765164 [Kalaharituber pfeilii]|nr:hypothetical protein BDZ91DRAFT_765164 [Kalaharituber pfeilii]
MTCCLGATISGEVIAGDRQLCQGKLGRRMQGSKLEYLALNPGLDVADIGYGWSCVIAHHLNGGPSQRGRCAGQYTIDITSRKSGVHRRLRRKCTNCRECKVELGVGGDGPVEVCGVPRTGAPRLEKYNTTRNSGKFAMRRSPGSRTSQGDSLHRLHQPP